MLSYKTTFTRKFLVILSEYQNGKLFEAYRIKLIHKKTTYELQQFYHKIAGSRSAGN